MKEKLTLLLLLLLILQHCKSDLPSIDGEDEAIDASAKPDKTDSETGEAFRHGDEDENEKVPTSTLYVSQMCGIRAYWDDKMKVCISIPPQKGAGESVSLESYESMSDEISEEPLGKFQIVNVECGIGYKFLRAENRCEKVEP